MYLLGLQFEGTLAQKNPVTGWEPIEGAADYVRSYKAGGAKILVFSLTETKETIARVCEETGVAYDQILPLGLVPQGRMLTGVVLCGQNLVEFEDWSQAFNDIPFSAEKVHV